MTDWGAFVGNKAMRGDASTTRWFERVGVCMDSSRVKLYNRAACVFESYV